MPEFRIFPRDSFSPASGIEAKDAAHVLLIVGRLDCREADVLQDGVYDFSLRLDDSGAWHIFQRSDEETRIPIAG